MNRHVLKICVLLFSFLLLPNIIYANQVAQKSAHTIDAYYLNSNYALVNELNQDAKIINLKTSQTMFTYKTKEKILYTTVLKNPNKIVFLLETQTKKIKKVVMSYDGAILSSMNTSLASTGDSIKWIAPVGNINERIMIQNGNEFNLYQHPWKRASVTYNAVLKDPSFENISIKDWDYVSYPYLAIKYQGDGIMSENYFVKVVNLYSKQSFTKKFFLTDFNIKLLGNNLSIFTFYKYQAAPASVSTPNSSEEQTFYERIQLKDGNESIKLSGLFNESEQTYLESGWATVYSDDKVFVGDYYLKTWDLYNLDGKLLVNDAAWPNGNDSKFISYDEKNKQAFFLVYDSNRKVSVKSIQL